MKMNRFFGTLYFRDNNAKSQRTPLRIFKLRIGSVIFIEGEMSREFFRALLRNDRSSSFRR